MANRKVKKEFKDLKLGDDIYFTKGKMTYKGNVLSLSLDTKKEVLINNGITFTEVKTNLSLGTVTTWYLTEKEAKQFTIKWYEDQIDASAKLIISQEEMIKRCLEKIEEIKSKEKPDEAVKR